MKIDRNFKFNFENPVVLKVFILAYYIYSILSPGQGFNHLTTKLFISERHKLPN
jgi:hypothetical protein